LRHLDVVVDLFDAAAAGTLAADPGTTHLRILTCRTPRATKEPGHSTQFIPHLGGF
jgi:hypothetical protein